MVVVNVTSAAIFTLSDQALMLLDDNQVNTPVNIHATDVAGPGVVFDISYPGAGSSIYWVSSIYDGGGSLTGTDISMYSAFALDFTLLSVNGQKNYSNGGDSVIAGALINSPSSIYAYQPQVLNFNNQTRVVSTTTSDADVIKLVGFCLNIPTWWYQASPSPWNPNGNTVSVLVQAAPNAVPLTTPEPASLLLLGLGGLALQHRRRQ
jgi:hypothetical protein